jgi:hypothetical protein
MKEYKLQTVFNVFYRYLMAKPPKTVIHTNNSGRCIFHSINLKFYGKAKNSICNKVIFFLFTATRR